jgi:uncharacterized protein YdhG (YjbR/CyaY superfamily)
MDTRKSAPASIDEYIAAAPEAVRPILEKIREIIRVAAPDAQEVISYRMPAFRQHGILLYFAAFKNHIGLFPPVEGDEKLEKAIAPYAGPKGNLKFPLGQPMPYGLIERIARLRAKQDRDRNRGKKSPPAGVARAGSRR